MNDLKSLHDQALQWMPGGVNSPVRASHDVDQNPIYTQEARGAYLYTTEGRKLIDCVGGFGPAILGHSHPKVVSALQDALQRGFCYGTSSVLEIEMAKELCDFSNHVEQVRLVNSGTEACMTAIRLARGCTGRNKIIKFSGCYHGHVDALLVQAGSGCLQHGVPSSPGIPERTVEDTLVCRFNDSEHFLQLCQQHQHDLAGIIIEPIAGNMNLVFPELDFLRTLRKGADQCGALLIFDEVMTGFRVHPKGAQGLLSVIADCHPDLTVLGKIIGGGLPIGALAGPKKLMSFLSPEGPIYQAGTLSGNPLTMTAGLATLKQLKNENHLELAKKTTYLIKGLKERAETHGITLQTDACGGMFGFFFSEHPVDCLENIPQQHAEYFNIFHGIMQKNGIHFAPSAFEVGMISFAHTDEDIQCILNASEEAFSHCQKLISA